MSNVKLHNAMRTHAFKIFQMILVAFGFALVSSVASAQTIINTVAPGTGGEVAPGAACGSSDIKLFDDEKYVGYDYDDFMSSDRTKSSVTWDFSSAQNRPKLIELYVVEDDGSLTLLDQVSSYNKNSEGKGVSLNKLIGAQSMRGSTDPIIGYSFTTATYTYSSPVKTLSNSRLQSVSVNLDSERGIDYYGRTLVIAIHCSSGLTASSAESAVLYIYFDYLGAYSVETEQPGRATVNLPNDSQFITDEIFWEYFYTVCNGDGPVEMKINNEEGDFVKVTSDDPDAVTNVVSSLGNTYLVKYGWEINYDSWGRTKGVTVANGNSCTDDFVAAQTTTGYSRYTPYMYVYNYTVDKGITVSQDINCKVRFDNDFLIYNFRDLVVNNSFKNETSGAEYVYQPDPDDFGATGSSPDTFVVCYGDEVTYTPSFEQDLMEDYPDEASPEARLYLLSQQVNWTLQEIDPETGVVIKDIIERDPDDFGYNIEYAGEEDFINLGVFEKTRSFKLTAEYWDDYNHSRRATEGGYEYYDDNGILLENHCKTERIFTIEVREISAEVAFANPADPICEEDSPEFVATASIPSTAVDSNYAYRWFVSADGGNTFSNLDPVSGDYINNGDASWMSPSAGIKVVDDNVVYPSANTVKPGYKNYRLELANTYVFDGTTYYCPNFYDHEAEINLRPVVDPVSVAPVCENQPFSFSVHLNDDYVIPSEGITYEIFEDEECSSPASFVIPMKNAASLASSDFNQAQSGRDIWWGVEKATKSHYDLWVKATNLKTGCDSHPVKIEIDVLPSPSLSNAIADLNSYCLNADVSDLKISADINSEYSSFDFEAVGVAKPSLTYHWFWSTPSGNDYQAVTSELELSASNSDFNASFSDISAKVGSVNFKVYATDDQGCGFNLNYDGSVVSENSLSGSANEPASVDVLITALPDFDIETSVEVCDDSKSLDLQLTSNDSRTLTFEFSPAAETATLADGSYLVPTVNPVVVAGNSSDFVNFTFSEDDIDVVSTFIYDVKVTDDKGVPVSCVDYGTMSFTIHPVPHIQTPKVFYGCNGQPISFYVDLADITVIPSQGVSYKVYSSEDCSTEAAVKVMADATSSAASNFYSASSSRRAWWQVESLTSDMTFWVKVVDNATLCESAPMPVSIKVIPLPEVVSIVAENPSYCKDATEIKSLNLTANLNPDYLDFEYPAELGLASRKVTYHWSWSAPSGVKASQDVVDFAILSNSKIAKSKQFSSKLSAAVGDIDFSLYVTDNYGCGYVLDGALDHSSNTSALELSHAIVEIKSLPDFSIESDKWACSDAGSIDISLTSNDSRELTFNFSPKNGAPDVTVNDVVVSGNSSNSVNIAFDESAISTITTYEYDVIVTDNTSLNCQDKANMSFTVHPVPYLQTPAVFYGCLNQPVSFSVDLADVTVIPSEGVSYQVYSDASCTTPASVKVMSDAVSSASSTYYSSTSLRKAWWQVESLSSDVTFYVKVVNEATGCQSAPMPVTIKCRPLPVIQSVVASVKDYCKDDDASALEVAASLNSSYSGFDFASLGLDEPVVSYHWSWFDAAGTQLGSEVTSASKSEASVMSGYFSTLETAVVGAATFSVYATDDFGCGYVLEGDLSHSSDKYALTSATESITIHHLPFFSIESGVSVCASNGSASLNFKNDDDSNLEFQISPIGSAPVPDAVNSDFSVEKGSSFDFSVVFDPESITDVTTFSYDVHVIDNTALNCSGDSTFSFVVYPNPVLEFSTDESDRHLCLEQSFSTSVIPSLTINGSKVDASKFSYSWSIDGVEYASSQSISWSAPAGTATGNHTFEVVVSFVNESGDVCSSSKSMQVFVNPLPTVALSASSDNICEGESTILSATISNDDALNHSSSLNTYSYTLSPADASSESSSSAADFEVAPTSSQSYSVVATNTVTGCVSPVSNTVDITVDRKGHIKFTALDVKEVCAGVNTVVISYQIVNPDEFVGLDFATLSFSNGAVVLDHDDSSITLQGDFESNVVFSNKTVSLKTLAGCDVVVDNSQTLKVYPVPDAPEATEPVDHVICQGEEVVLRYFITSPTSKFEYEWFVSDSQPAVDATPYLTTAGSDAVFDYSEAASLTSSTKVWVRTVDVTHATNCKSAFSSYDIIVNPNPVPVVDPVAAICENEKATISISSPIADADNSYFYRIYDAKGNLVTAEDNTSMSYETVELSKSTVYYLTVVNSSTECFNYDALSIPVTVKVRPTAVTNVAYADKDGSSSVVLPDVLNKTVAKASFCYAEEGTATVTITPTLENPESSFDSELTSVSNGSVSDWVKVDASTWTCHRASWTDNVTLTFVLTDEACQSLEFTTDVTVQPVLEKPVLSADLSEYCRDEVKNFNFNIESYSGLNSNINFVIAQRKLVSGVESNILSSSKSGNIATSTEELGMDQSTEFYVYAVNLLTGCISETSDPVTISINELPVPSYTSSDADGIICPADEVTLSIVGDYVAYSWPDEEAGKATTSSIVVSPSSKGVHSYQYLVQDDKGCWSVSQSATLVVRPKPEFSLVASPSVVCQGSSTDVEIIPSQLNGLGSEDNLTFVEPYAFTTLGGSSAVVSSELQGDGSYKYLVSGHVWDEASVSFSAVISSADINNSCSSDPVSVSVEVISSLAKPDAFSTDVLDGVTPSKTIHICEGSTDVVTAYVSNTSDYNESGVTYSYLWFSDPAGSVEISDGVDGFSIDSNKGTLSFVPSASTTLYVKAVRNSEPECESELSDVVSVIIESLPDAPIALTPSDPYICIPEEASESISLSVSLPADDNSYRWYRQSDLDDDDMADDDLVATGIGSVAATIVAPSETSFYYARTVSKYGCVSSSKSNVVTVEVHENPVITAILAPESDICRNGDIKMQVGVESPMAGITYKYVKTSPDDSSVYEEGFIDESADGYIEFLSIPNPAQSQTWVYTFTAIYGGACESLNSVVYEVKVHAFPDYVVSASPNPICEGQDLTVSVSGVKSREVSDGIVISFSDANGALVSEQLVKNGESFDFNIEGIKRSQLPISYVVRDAEWSSCSEDGVVSFVLNDIPEFDITNSDGEVDATPTDDAHTYDYCLGESMTLNLSADLPVVDNNGLATSYEFQWMKNGAIIPGAVTSSYSISNLKASNQALYTLVVTSNGCTFSRSAQVNVHSDPVPVINYDGQYFCTDDVLTLSCEQDDFVSYRWDVLYSGEVNDNDGSEQTLVYNLADKSFDVDNLLPVELYVVDKFGCSNSLAARKNVSLANPPVISDVFGTETCDNSPFVISVSQDKSSYTLSLLDADGSALDSDSYSLDESGTVLTTSADLPEGDYTLVVTDGTSLCPTKKVVHLSRYAITVTVSTPSDNDFFCENSSVAYSVSIADSNSHDDFLSKISSLKYNISYLNNAGDVVFSEPVDDVMSLSVEHTFDPLTVGLTAGVDSYTIKASVEYVFSSDVASSYTCKPEGVKDINIVPTPVLTVSPVMPACLGSDFVFSVDESLVSATNPIYTFFINGSEIQSSSNSSLVMADYPAVELVQGDEVFVNVTMNAQGTVCSSNVIVVNYFGDFKVAISDFDATATYCKGADVPFTVSSVLPDGLDDSFVLNNIKSYDVFVKDSNVDSLFASVSDVDALSSASHFNYSGDDDVIDVYVVATDVNGCVKSSSPISVNIKQFHVDGFAVVDLLQAKLMDTHELCADIEYWFTPQLRVGSAHSDGSCGNDIVSDWIVDNQHANYEYYYSIDGSALTRSDVKDPVLKYIFSDGSHNIRIEVLSLETGCKTEFESSVYPSYDDDYIFHAKPVPAEVLTSGQKPISDDSDDARTFEVCYADEFSFDVSGSVVSVVYDSVRVVTFANGVANVLNESSISASQISASFADDTTSISFNINPSADFHSVQFVVSDGTCEVASDVWNFRMFEDFTLSAINADGNEAIVGDVLTLCVGDNIDVVGSTSEPGYSKAFNFTYDSVAVNTDFGLSVYNVVATAVGDYELVVKPDFGVNECYHSITVHVNEAPVPLITMSDGEGGALEPISYDADSHSYLFDRCEEVSTVLTASGASDYTLSVTKDGVDVTSSFSSVGSGEQFSQNVDLTYDSSTASGEGVDSHNEYVFSYTYSVGNCFDVASATVRVYATPSAEFIDGTPSELIIAGSTVPVHVSDGYVNYEFFINDVSVASGASNTYDATQFVDSVAGSNTIKVVVTSAHGCVQEISKEVTVLEGLKPRDVIASSDFYCTTSDGKNGVTISVVDPQVGVTYQIVGRDDIAPSDSAVWNDVRIDDKSVNPENFSVIAYYAALPDAFIPMNNSVSVEEVAAPEGASMPYLFVNNCEDAQSESLTWTINNPQFGISYFLTKNDVVLSDAFSSATPEQSSIVLNVHDILFAQGGLSNGTYKILAQSQRLNGDYVCDSYLSDSLQVELPETELFDVLLSVGNGVYCEDDKAGVDIYIPGSDFTSLYDHEYALLLDGVEVDTPRKVSTSERGEIRFSNVMLPDGVTSGVYTIVCYFNGCRSAMNNSVELRTIANPVQQSLTVDNYGHYCAEDGGVSITVGGQEEGVRYQLFLIESDNTLSKVGEHIGDDSGAAFSFDNVIEAGVYKVQMSIPSLGDREFTSCNSYLDEPVEVFVDAKPINPQAKFVDETICIGDQTNLMLLSPDVASDGSYSVTYQLYDQNGLVSSDAVYENFEDSYLQFLNIMPSEPGVYTYSVIATKVVEKDGVVLNTCVQNFDDVVSLTVLPHPSDGTETLTVLGDDEGELAGKIAEDACYGVDIVVNNPNSSAEYIQYELYLYNSDGVIDFSSPVAVVTPSQVISDGYPDVRFVDVRNGYGVYAVYASNGVCRDKVSDDIVVSLDKYPTVQNLVADGRVCQGDAGSEISLEDSEANTSYRLWFEPALNPENAVEISSYVTSADHEAVRFENIDYHDGSDVSDLIDRDGKYYVKISKVKENGELVGCEVESPKINFETLKLPKSFRLLADEHIYCDGDGVSIYLQKSELVSDAKITYRLYSMDENENVEFVQSLVSNGQDSLAFKSPVPAGTYVAIAIKEFLSDGHICTSSMEGSVVVEKKEPISDLIAKISTNLDVCGSDVASYSLPDAAVVSDVFYYVSNSNTSAPAATDYSGATTFNLFDGVNYIWASYYEGACEDVIAEVNVARYNSIPSDLFNETRYVCGSQLESIEIPFSSATKDAVYYLYRDDVEVASLVADGSNVVFDVDLSGDSEGSYLFEVKASNPGCGLVSVGSVEFRKKNLIPSVEPVSLSACGDDEAVFTISGDYSNMLFSINGSTFTGTSDGVELRGLSDGANIVKAFYSDGKSCENSEFAVITVNRFANIPSSLFDTTITLNPGESSKEFSISSVADGASYYYVADSSSVEIASSVSGVFSYDFAQGDYEIRASFDGVCDTYVGTLHVRNCGVELFDKTIYLCGETEASDTISGDLSSVTFEVTNDEIDGRVLFDGKSDGVVLRHLVEGKNNVRAYYWNDGGYCESSCVINVVLNDVIKTLRYDADILATNGVPEIVIGDSVLTNGVTYELYDLNDNLVAKHTYQAAVDGASMTLSSSEGIAEGDYKVYAYYQLDSDSKLCEDFFGNISFSLTHCLEKNYVAINDTVYVCNGDGLDLQVFSYVNSKFNELEFVLNSNHFTAQSSVVDFSGLTLGQNLVYAKYIDSECDPIVIGSIFVTTSIKTVDRILLTVCGDGVTDVVLPDSLLTSGVTYTLYDDSDELVKYSAEQNDSSVIFSGVPAGSYLIQAYNPSTDCSISFANVIVSRRDAIESLSNDVRVFTCSSSSVDLAEQFAGQLITGATYYITGDTISSHDSFENGVVYDGGESLVFNNLVPGNYSIWASFDNFNCLSVVAGLKVSADFNDVFDDLQITADGICEATAPLISINNSSYGVSYYLADSNFDIISSYPTLLGNGSDLSWTIDSNASDVKYVVASLDDCQAVKSVSFKYDKDALPDGYLTLYIQGVAYTSESTDIPEICPGSSIMVTGIVDNATVESYSWYRNDELRETTSVNTFIPVYADEQLAVTNTFTVKMSITTTGGCEYEIDDAITFKVRNDYAKEEHLVAQDGIYEYCEGEEGVKLAFINYAMKGYVYRLYQEGDSASVHDDLIDIQEIPSYDDSFSPADSLFFNGWGYGSASADYATKGFYYVMVQSPDGCNMRTNTVEVVENPQPIDPIDSAFFAVLVPDVNGVMTVDRSTTSQEFGLVDGYMVLSNAKPGVSYSLYNEDHPDTCLQVIYPVEEGPIYFKVFSSQQDSIENNLQHIADSQWGEGTYYIVAENMTTGCSNTIGYIIFVDDELVAYDVEIYLNKNEMTRTTSLVPAYGWKSTKRYISWSSKIDRVFLPVMTYDVYGNYVIDEDSTALLNYANNSGYTNVASNSNIMFQIVPPDHKINGIYGLVKADYTTNDTAAVAMCTNTGWFKYVRNPSFYGKEEIQYYIYNSKMPSRVSNIATISILCGNENTGDDNSVFLIPNAFSPNGDGYNDVFKIIIPDKYQENSESKLEVFNRWGTLVYRSSGLQYGQDCPWWDGNSSSSNMVTIGSKLPSGTYYYVFSITFIDPQEAVKSERKMHGYIELRR